jgi:hypothetical protein
MKLHLMTQGVVEGRTACNSVGLRYANRKKNATRDASKVTCKRCMKSEQYRKLFKAIEQGKDDALKSKDRYGKLPTLNATKLEGGL